MAPIVVNLKNKTGLQAIHGDSGYSHRHPLRLEEELVAC
jgi:flagellar assembly factor FliW